MSLIGALNVLKAGQAAKKTAPFYSAVDEALANLKRPKGTGAEFFTELSKQAGVKKAELADRKLEQAFKAKGKITKEEAQKILKENPPPKLQEREYNEKMVREEEDIKEELAQQMYGRSYEDLSHRDRRPIFDETQRIMGEENGPQYGDYKTQGGENYREILLKLPVQGEDVKKLNEISMALHGVPYTSLLGDKSELAKMRLAVKREYKNVYGESGRVAEDRGMYQSNHWKEDPNVLAHMRVQDRTGPNGEKILHVEEIQSDWHQAGRKKGYKPDNYIEQSNALDKEFNDLGEKRAQLLKQAELMPTHGPEFTSLLDEANSITPKLMRLQEQRDKMRDVINYGVPDAPFKKNWHELAMKRLLNYAADNGYDSIAITPGAEQAKRYDLSKQISKIDYNKFDSGQNELKAWDKDGKKVFEKYGASQDDVANYIGKEAAEKLFAATPKDNHMGGQRYSLIGEDLQVGGEGMKGFYDQILPSYLNTFGKPYGAQVQQLQIPVKHELQGLRTMGGYPEEPPLTMHNFPITPEMRQQIQQKGLPLYQQIGIPTAGAGAASQIPEQMQEPELEPEVKKADGGAINYNTAPDMSDGGRIIQGAPFKRGGKVNISTNRDAMFMELSNKKLKRK